MSQADSEPITADTFAAFATFLGTPLPDDPVRAVRILRREAAAEIERLITMLDALGGDPDLEDGADAEPTLGWPIGNGRLFGSVEDGELEPSLGWTGIINQASRNRLGDSDGQDYEKDDADKEDSDPAEESDFGELEPDLEADEDASDASRNPDYYRRLKERRGPRKLPRRFIVSPEGIVHELLPT